MQRIPSLYIAPSARGGRGVFTAAALQAGDLIEICPVVVLPPKDLVVIHTTHLHDYYFLWEDDHAAIALGYGSLYNHARHPNADYEMHYDQQTIHIICVHPIARGEEITINYSDEDRDERTKLWFDER